MLSSVKSRNETLIPKATRSTNAGKKLLAATLQISHLLLQKLDADIYGLNGWTDFPHKEGLGNLTKMLKNKLHNKTYADKLLYRSPPLQNSLGRNSVDEVMFNIIQHTSQHF